MTVAQQSLQWKQRFVRPALAPIINDAFKRGRASVDRGDDTSPLPDAEPFVTAILATLERDFGIGFGIFPSRSRLAAVPQPDSGWRPIETAPRDRTPVLAGWFSDDGGSKYDPLHTIAYDADTGWWYDEYGDDYMEPTHWMPLPAPPVTPAAPEPEPVAEERQ